MALDMPCHSCGTYCHMVSSAKVDQKVRQRRFAPAGRISRSGPELRLIEAALSSGLLYRRSSHPIIFREPALPTGFPDLVAVYPRASRKAVSSPARNLLTPKHLRLLHHLVATGPNTRAQLETALAWPSRSLKLHLEALASAELVEPRYDKLVARSISRIFWAQKIVAIEAKVSSWRDALQQAVANTWFASHSYILLPALRSLEQVKHEAFALGIGVMVLKGSNLRVALPPRVCSIPASYGSWLVNEWLVRSMNEE